MAGQRRGFTKERHGALKAAIAAVAVAGFGVSWLGFAGSHDEPSGVDNPSSETPTPAGPGHTPSPAGTAAISPNATPTAKPEPTTAGDPPEPSATASRPRRSRGS